VGSAKEAVRAGIALFSCAILLLASGLVLTRLGVFEVRDPTVRGVSYWLHVITPVAVAWLFVLHRLAGARIKWRLGIRWAAFAASFALEWWCVTVATAEHKVSSRQSNAIRFENDRITITAGKCFLKSTPKAKGDATGIPPCWHRSNKAPEGGLPHAALSTRGASS